MTSVTNPLGSFGYGYDGLTSRLKTVTYPTGLTRTYNYFPEAQDHRLQEIRNEKPGGINVSRFGYTQDAENNIKTWSQTADANPAKAYDLGYDAADQLTSATLKDASSGALLKRYGYAYDKAGNRTAEQIDDASTAAVPNTVNELVSLQPGGALIFRGTTSESASVTVQSKPAATTADNKFEGQASVGQGSTTVAVSATDPSGNTKTQNYQVSLTGATRTLSYDPNGNLTGDGIRTYEWDAVDRLAAVNEGTKRSEFTYDGFSRRTRIVEKLSGATTSDKRLMWVGRGIAEEREASGGTTTKRYFGQGIQQGSTSLYYAKDHLGSVRELIDTAGTVRARYDYDPYGRRTKTAGDLDPDLGFAGMYQHAATGLSLTLYRPYDPGLGRWTTRDPIGLKGGINLYAYVAGDPINRIDPLGLFNTFAHEYILDHAFDGEIPAADIETLNDASKFTDARFQDPGYSYMHAMTDGTRNQSTCAAQNQYWSFLEQQMKMAANLEASGFHVPALQQLGMGMHAIMDNLSPAHSGFKPWNGVVSELQVDYMTQHFLEELVPMGDAMNQAKADLLNYYDAFMDTANGRPTRWRRKLCGPR